MAVSFAKAVQRASIFVGQRAAAGAKRFSLTALVESKFYTADEVDEVLTELERRFELAQTLLQRGAKVRLAAAERDVLAIAETMRDLLEIAAGGSKELLADVFGGDCERFHRVRRVLNAMTFTDVGNKTDQRWEQMAEVVDILEELLKHHCIWRPPKNGPPERIEYRGWAEALEPGRPVHFLPTVFGDVALSTLRWSVKPILPQFLTLDVKTGEIGGRPKSNVPIPLSRFVIVAENHAGKAQVEVNLSCMLGLCAANPRRSADGGPILSPALLLVNPRSSAASCKGGVAVDVQPNSSTIPEDDAGVVPVAPAAPATNPQVRDSVTSALEGAVLSSLSRGQPGGDAPRGSMHAIRVRDANVLTLVSGRVWAGLLSGLCLAVGLIFLLGFSAAVYEAAVCPTPEIVEVECGESLDGIADDAIVLVKCPYCDFDHKAAVPSEGLLVAGSFPRYVDGPRLVVRVEMMQCVEEVGVDAQGQEVRSYRREFRNRHVPSDDFDVDHPQFQEECEAEPNPDWDGLPLNDGHLVSKARVGGVDIDEDMVRTIPIEIGVLAYELEELDDDWWIQDDKRGLPEYRTAARVVCPTEADEGPICDGVEDLPGCTPQSTQQRRRRQRRASCPPPAEDGPPQPGNASAIGTATATTTRRRPFRPVTNDRTTTTTTTPSPTTATSTTTTTSSTRTSTSTTATTTSTTSTTTRPPRTTRPSVAPGEESIGEVRVQFGGAAILNRNCTMLGRHSGGQLGGWFGNDGCRKHFGVKPGILTKEEFLAGRLTPQQVVSRLVRSPIYWALLVALSLASLVSASCTKDVMRATTQVTNTAVRDPWFAAATLAGLVVSVLLFPRYGLPAAAALTVAAVALTIKALAAKRSEGRPIDAAAPCV